MAHEPESQMTELAPFHDVFPGDWAAVRQAIDQAHTASFARTPEVRPFDLADLQVPDDVRREIVNANRRRVRGEMSREELLGPSSRYQSLDEFDEQLAEILASLEHRYHPRDYIRQVIQLGRKFLSVTAALRLGAVAQRLTPQTAAECLREVVAARATADDDLKIVLDLLVMDLTQGGREAWVGELPDDAAAEVHETLARQAAR